MRDFRQVQVWEKSHQLTLTVYDVTKNYPREELFGLISQMRRSSASIATNIAEGCGRSSDADFARFLSMSSGSASELEYQIILSHDLKYIEEDQFYFMTNKIKEIKRMLHGFSQKLKAES